MKTKDGRALARENELNVMRALHRFGWLRTRNLAALVWQRWARNPAEVPSLCQATPGIDPLATSGTDPPTRVDDWLMGPRAGGTLPRRDACL